MKIFLKTHFYLEEEIPFLKLNFLEGKKYFDKFIISEFNYSKTGLKKDYVDLKKFDFFSEEDYRKIEYHQIDLTNKIKPAFDNNDSECRKNMSLNNEGLFRNEFVNYHNFNDDDIIISVDADEIIYSNFYEKLLKKEIKLPAKLKMHHFTYKINNYCGQTWYSPLATIYTDSKDYKQEIELNNKKYIVNYPNWRDQGEVTKECCGCHFSWCLNPEAMKSKIKFHGIGVNQDPENSQKFNIEKKIKNREFTKKKPFSVIKVRENNSIYPKSLFSMLEYFN